MSKYPYKSPASGKTLGCFGCLFTAGSIFLSIAFTVVLVAACIWAGAWVLQAMGVI